MKKLILLIIIIFCLCLNVQAKNTPLYKNSINLEGIGVLKMPNEFSIYEEPTLKSKIIQNYSWGKNEGAYVNDDYSDNFIIFDPLKNIGYMTVVDDSEELGWYKICYDQKNKLTGWVFLSDYKFYPWLSFYQKFGKLNGLYPFRDLETTEKRMYSKPEFESQILNTFEHVKDIRIQIFRGNWVLVRLYDFEGKMKIGWIKWRTDEGKFLFFPNVLK